jgi:hypothetical protein
MIVALSVLFALTPFANAQDGVVSWWQADKNFTDSVGGYNGSPAGAITFAAGRIKEAFNLDGASARVYIPDSPAFQLSNTLAISAWIWVRDWPTGPSGEGQILFRGDDRIGLDPYFMEVSGPNSVLGQGNVSFAIEDGNNNAVIVLAPIALHEWIYVVGTFSPNGRMQLFVNGKMVDQAYTNIHPLSALDSNYTPGIGIGNVQSTFADEYFDGLIDDVKLYNKFNPVVIPAGLSPISAAVHGGDAGKVALTLSDSPFTPLVVSLKSSNPAVLSVPASTTAPAGLYSSSFGFKTAAVTTAKAVTVTATVNGHSSTTTVTVSP